MGEKIVGAFEFGSCIAGRTLLPIYYKEVGERGSLMWNDGMGSKPYSGFAQARQHDPGPICPVAWCLDQAGEIPGAPAPQSQWTDPAVARYSGATTSFRGQRDGTSSGRQSAPSKTAGPSPQNGGSTG